MPCWASSSPSITTSANCQRFAQAAACPAFASGYKVVISANNLFTRVICCVSGTSRLVTTSTSFVIAVVSPSFKDTVNSAVKAKGCCVYVGTTEAPSMKWRMPAVTVKRSISKLLGMVLVVTKPSVSCVSIALSSQKCSS